MPLRSLLLVLSLAAVLAVGVWPSAGHAGQGEAIFAVVVGNNRSPDRSLPTLRFADDDAAKFYELFVGLGGQAKLVTLFDATSQTRFAHLRGRAAVPRRSALLSALRATYSAIRRAQSQGRRTVFYFVFSGHGSLASTGMGQLHLFDGTFTRRDLLKHVVARSPATVNHLIIDACHAYFVVHSKGKWRQDKSKEDYSALLDRFLRNERIERYPNTGVLLATATSAETHEWSRIESGLFSHQIRSALTGAADVSNDGTVTYPEVAAYVAAANSKVANDRARLKVFARPPGQHHGEPVVRLKGRKLHRVRMARSLAGHFYLEDPRGSRYADFHKSAEAELSLVLLSPGGGHYHLRGKEVEQRIELSSTPGTVEVAQLVPRTLVARGAIDEALRRGLYAVPFGPGYYAGFLAVWQQGLQRPLPTLASAPATAPSTSTTRTSTDDLPQWRVDLGYLLTRPALTREGLAHGLKLRGGRRLLPWLELGLGASYIAAGAHEGGWDQDRITVTADLSAELAPLQWLNLRAEAGLGYLALFESVGDQRRGDPTAFTFHLLVGPELRLPMGFWLTVRGGVQVDAYDSDGEARTGAAPVLLSGLALRI